jgi:tetratricopeptide (TPR) repeat protein
MLGAKDIVCRRASAPAASESLDQRPLNYRFTTGKQGEHGRRWLSKLRDSGGKDVALWNPMTLSYSTAVFDDFGEQLPPGPGDLVLGLSIPDGRWRLSLAFLNDHNYYESSRRYTIHLRDSSGRFLTGCDVEDFLTPLYKQFAVQGPGDLTVHVFRDNSLNTLLSGIFLDPLGPTVSDAPLSAGLPLGSLPVIEGVSPSAETPERLDAPYPARSADEQRSRLSAVPEDALPEIMATLHRHGDSGAALLLQEAAISRAWPQDPDRALNLTTESVSQHKSSGRVDLAFKVFQYWLDLACRSPQKEKICPLINTAMLAQVAQENWPMAQAALARLEALSPADSDDAAAPPQLRYRVNMAVGQYSSAAKALERIIQEARSHLMDDLPDPEASRHLADSYFDLTLCYAAGNQLAEAQKAIEEGSAFFEDKERLANAHYLVALQALRGGTAPDRAAFLFRQVVERYPNTHWAEKAKYYLKAAERQTGK